MDRPVKPTLDVAIAMFDFGPTGVVRNAIRIAAAARDAGLAVEIWVAQDSGVLRSEVPEGLVVRSFGKPLGTQYSRRDRRRAGRSAAPALSALLDCWRPRVLLSAGNHLHSVAAAAATRAKVPVRLVLRISTGLPRPATPNPYRWARYLFKRAKAVRRQARAFALIAVSREIADELHRDMRVEQNVTIIPNGIDAEVIERRSAEPFDHPWFASGAPPVILGVGRIDRYKNFELLIAAFIELRRTQNLRLVILGQERNAWRHRLEAMIDRAGVGDDVMFDGFQPNPHPYFSKAAAFVCCSRYEGMSNAMLEAMANGCPVVATTTVTGASELLDKGRLGPLAEPTAEALANAIAARISRPRDSETLRARARQYDLAETTSAYVRLLEDLARSEMEDGSHDDCTSARTLAA